MDRDGDAVASQFDTRHSLPFACGQRTRRHADLRRSRHGGLHARRRTAAYLLSSTIGEVLTVFLGVVAWCPSFAGGARLLCSRRASPRHVPRGRHSGGPRGGLGFLDAQPRYDPGPSRVVNGPSRKHPANGPGRPESPSHALLDLLQVEVLVGVGVVRRRVLVYVRDFVIGEQRDDDIGGWKSRWLAAIHGLLPSGADPVSAQPQSRRRAATRLQELGLPKTSPRWQRHDWRRGSKCSALERSITLLHPLALEQRWRAAGGNCQHPRALHASRFANRDKATCTCPARLHRSDRPPAPPNTSHR